MLSALLAAAAIAGPLGHVAAGDPLYPSQWWYPRVGADRVEPPGAGVPVTVVDSGVDVSHEEFAGRPDVQVLNGQRVDDEHGTAVTSVLAAPANGVGLVGSYPRAALRIWDASPRGVLSTRELAAALDSAPGRSVISISIGSVDADPVLAQAVLRALRRGCVVVASAGNTGLQGNQAAYPGAFPHVLTVAATTQDDSAAIFSTRSRWVDVAAPGVSIPVAVPGGYKTVEGTSYSTPIVAGAVAWLWTARPQLDNTQVVELVRRTARDLGAPGRDEETGFGLLDLPRALAARAPARDPKEPNDTVEQAASTAPIRGRATFTARLDVPEDPADVYRVWVPAGARVTVEARSVHPLVLRAGRLRSSQRLVLTNATSRGRHAHVLVRLPRVAGSDDARYTLSVTARP